MFRHQDALIDADRTLLDALRVIDRSSLQIALIVDHDHRLIGTLTDGDIRRALLRGEALTTPVRAAMNPHPVTAGSDVPDDELMAIMIRRSISELPIVDAAGRVVGLKRLADLAEAPRRDNLAVIMAGGLGSRLGELTRTVPKPMLPVGQRPIIGTIVSQLVRHGFQRIVVAINYLGDQIEAYLGNGSAFGADISYLKETKRLGTAGALGLLRERPTAPFLVMNGDLLTAINFGNLVDFHVANGRLVTVAIRDFQFRVPYGVMKLRGTELVGIEEKQLQTLVINAGIYVLEPATIDWITPDQPCDMPTIIERAIGAGAGVACFPLQQYWLDIGRLEDFQRAQIDIEAGLAGADPGPLPTGTSPAS